MNPYERLMFVEAYITDMLANDCDTECNLYKSLCNELSYLSDVITEGELLSYAPSCDSEPSTAKQYPMPSQIALSL